MIRNHFCSFVLCLCCKNIAQLQFWYIKKIICAEMECHNGAVYGTNVFFGCSVFVQLCRIMLSITPEYHLCPLVSI